MTETKRCSPCNKSKHYLCHKGHCSCKCQKYEDNKRNIEPEPTNYSIESQAQFDGLMESWRNRKQ